jgi:hypothetical protein
MTIIPLAPPLLAGSSNLPGSIRRAVLLPYLVLLRAGFCLPPMLPPARCALTAPFHPYLNRGPERPAIGAVYFLCHCPSSCPDRGLPGALPCGVRTFLPLPPRLTALGRTAIVWLTAIVDIVACRRRMRPSRTRRCVSRRFPGKSGTARVFCTDCCAAYRWLRLSWRCSSHSPGACRRETRARRCL